MGQIGFFDLSKRYTGLDAKNEPLAKIDEVVPWEDFRGCLDAVWRRSDKARKSRAGRKPWDAVVMFKTIILSALYNLSDDQVEHQTRDRLSFMRFLGLGLEDRVPDAKTVWHERQAGVIETLFEVRWPPEGSGLSGRSSTPRWRCPNSATAARRTGDKGWRDAGMLAG